jgi:acyl-lipid (8-3)-desaturase
MAREAVAASSQLRRGGSDCARCGTPWWFYGKPHDLSLFMDTHPGGRRLLQEARGIDLTGLFESYHHSPERRAVLRSTIMPKYEVKKQEKDGSTMCADCRAHYQTWTWPSTFYDELSRRVAERLAEKAGLARFYWYVYWAAFAFVIVFGIGMHVRMFWLPAMTGIAAPVTAWTYVLAVLVGINMALLGGWGHNQMHQGGSRLDFLFGFTGLDTLRWTRTHVALHHVFTNLDADTDWEDIEALSSRVPVALRLPAILFGYHLFLKPKGLVLSTLRIVREAVSSDKALRPGDKKHSPKYVLPILWSFATWMAALSMPGQWKVLFVTEVSGWLWFLLIDYSNHYMEDTPRPNPIPSDWAMSQVVTSQDFYITGIGILDCILGIGLDRQLSHHLFPKMPHCYLSLIDPVVRQACRDVGVEPAPCPQLFANIPHILTYRFFTNRATQKSKSV